jgi:hypothetical protein
MTAPFAALLRARADALDAEARMLRELADHADAPAVPEAYSQHDGHRPAWLPTRVLYLRAWAALRREGHPGVTAHGKARVMSREAALAWRERTASEPRCRAAPAAPESGPRDVGPAIDAALGIRLRGSR